MMSGALRGDMIELIAQNLAPIMFAALVVFLLLGYPVAFSLAAVGMMFFVLGVLLAPYSGGAVNLSWPLMRTLPERIYGVMTNETLLAIPFFAFMGLILERSGMAEDLLETVSSCSDPCVAASPTPSSSSARCLPRRRAWWRRR